MGYRATFVTDDQSLECPPWFVEKWKGCTNFVEGNKLPISSQSEHKMGLWEELLEDLQKVLDDPNTHDYPGRSIFICFLWEDGAATHFVITKEEYKQYGDIPSPL